MKQAIILDKSSVKVIGASGQISLGKQYAGRQVLVEEPDEGVWVIRTARVIPDNEQWLHTKKNQASLERALDFAETHEPEETADPVAFP
jgi:putative transposon-encoded protein